MTTFLIILLVITSLVLIGSILLQPGKSAGLSGAIGGAESLFGKKKAKGYEATLSRITTIAAVVFMLSALILTMLQ